MIPEMNIISCKSSISRSGGSGGNQVSADLGSLSPSAEILGGGAP